MIAILFLKQLPLILIEPSSEYHNLSDIAENVTKAEIKNK